MDPKRFEELAKRIMLVLPRANTPEECMVNLNACLAVAIMEAVAHGPRFREMTENQQYIVCEGMRVAICAVMQAGMEEAFRSVESNLD